MSFKFRRLRAVEIAASVAALVASGGAVAAAAPVTADLVFYAPHFAKVENGRTIAYKFVRKAEDPRLAPSFEDVVNIQVGPEGNENSVTVTLFSGKRAIRMPNMSKTGNPVIVAILEQDTLEMNKTLGGSPVYFKNRLLEAMTDATQAEPTKIEYAGRTVDGWRVFMKPFGKDPSTRTGLREFAERTYELTFSDAVPGGLYAFKTVTPKAGGAGTLLTEELTVAEQAPAETKTETAPAAEGPK